MPNVEKMSIALTPDLALPKLLLWTETTTCLGLFYRNF